MLNGDTCLTRVFQNPKVLHKYVALHAANLIKDGHIIKALDLYVKYGAPPATQVKHSHFYNTIPKISNIFSQTGFARMRAVLHMNQSKLQLDGTNTGKTRNLKSNLSGDPVPQ